MKSANDEGFGWSADAPKRKPVRQSPFMAAISEETEEQMFEHLGEDVPYPTSRDAGKGGSADTYLLREERILDRRGRREWEESFFSNTRRSSEETDSFSLCSPASSAEGQLWRAKLAAQTEDEWRSACGLGFSFQLMTKESTGTGIEGSLGGDNTVWQDDLLVLRARTPTTELEGFQVVFDGEGVFEFWHRGSKIMNSTDMMHHIHNVCVVVHATGCLYRRRNVACSACSEG